MNTRLILGDQGLGLQIGQCPPAKGGTARSTSVVKQARFLIHCIKGELSGRNDVGKNLF